MREMREDVIMNEFFLTFGQKSPARNGWISIFAESYEVARKKAIAMYGNEWSMLYEKNEFDPEFFPAGQLGRIS